MKNGLRDGEAFDRLVEEHYDDVLAYCRRHAPSYDDAPDVAQEAFLRFVRSGRSPRDGKPLAYLFTIARNLCIDAARARRLPVGPLDVDVPDGSPDADPAMAIGGGEVDALVDALPPEPVSYTHLDVYKRQHSMSAIRPNRFSNVCSCSSVSEWRCSQAITPAPTAMGVLGMVLR